MTGKRIRRIISWNKWRVAVLYVQYVDGEVMQDIFDRGAAS